MTAATAPGTGGIWGRLSWWLWAIVALAVLIVLAEMAGGYVGSFMNLDQAARRAGWDLPWLLPLLADGPILAYVILDQVAVILGARARGLHYLAWGMAGFTVWANYQVAPAPSTGWRVIYAAMPAGWVAGVEALRWFWRLLRTGPAPERDRIPFGRWVAAPVETRRIQWRMWKLGERSWKRMSRIEDARAVALDVVQQLHIREHLVAPGHLADRISSARLPAPVLDTIDTAARFGSGTGTVETAVRDWVTAEMVLPEWVQISLDVARQRAADAAQEGSGAAGQTGPETGTGNGTGTGGGTGSGDGSGDPSGKGSGNPSQDGPPARLRKPSAAAVKRMSPEQLAPYVKQYAADLAEQGTAIKIQTVMDHLHIARGKAREALKIAQAKGASVIQLPARGTSAVI